ncbi:MAG: asparagine synthase (glutamine-hydrolyzing) [Patescibacteria group bacterium]
MCGIAGYVGRGDEATLRRMADSIRYRGPDDEGYFVENNVGIAHKRLSIIDLSRSGHQPMSGEDGNVIVAFNGEIYNFKKLRDELENRHRFVGNSDTEVIVHLYEEEGARAFSKLDGMFAIALYDKRAKKLYLVRDRFGKKPLYYARFKDTFLFGSELKAILAHPAAVKELSFSALNKYLQFEYVPTPETIFNNIFKLEPAHYLVYDGSSIEKTRFWDIPDDSFSAGATGSFDEAAQRLDGLLSSAVEKRLVSDVPLGVFLSGGIDSSTIAWYAARALRSQNKKLKTFSIGFREGSFDESSYARQVADFLVTDHREEILSAKDASALVPEIFSLLDEPLADASIIPTYLLSRFTRHGVTVALGGDGGDELLMGYDTFLAHRAAEYYNFLPQVIKKTIFSVVNNLPTSFKNMSFDFRAKKFIDGISLPSRYRNQRWLGAFSGEERKKLLSPKVWDTVSSENEFESIDSAISGKRYIDQYNELSYLYMRTYLLDDILVKVDRASMYHSLEVRAPFLDTELASYAIGLPREWKMNGFTTKYILKKLMENRLPQGIARRSKKGFGIPLAQWLMGDLKPLLLNLLSEERLKKQGIFNPQYVRGLIDAHLSRKYDNRKKLWALLVFQMWYEKWYA